MKFRSAWDNMLLEMEELNSEALFADGFERALIGHTVNAHANVVLVYDYDKCVKVLMDRDGMSDTDAVEFLEFNTIGAYVGENGPIFMKQMTAYDFQEKSDE